MAFPNNGLFASLSNAFIKQFKNLENLKILLNTSAKYEDKKNYLFEKRKKNEFTL